MVRSNKPTIEENVRAVNGNLNFKFVFGKISFLCCLQSVDALKHTAPPTHTFMSWYCVFLDIR
jgi:hypothetical protein